MLWHKHLVWFQVISASRTDVAALMCCQCGDLAKHEWRNPLMTIDRLRCCKPTGSVIDGTPEDHADELRAAAGRDPSCVAMLRVDDGGQQAVKAAISHWSRLDCSVFLVLAAAASLGGFILSKRNVTATS